MTLSFKKKTNKKLLFFYFILRHSKGTWKRTLEIICSGSLKEKKIDPVSRPTTTQPICCSDDFMCLPQEVWQMTWADTKESSLFSVGKDENGSKLEAGQKDNRTRGTDRWRGARRASEAQKMTDWLTDIVGYIQTQSKQEGRKRTLIGYVT